MTRISSPLRGEISYELFYFYLRLSTFSLGG
nr:MAG TPA: hypothetical protein [Caudoviricetes sp.]